MNTQTEKINAPEQRRREIDTLLVVEAAKTLPPQTETYLRVGTVFAKNQIRNMMIAAQEKRKDGRCTSARQKNGVVKIRCILRKNPRGKNGALWEINNTAKRLQPQEEAFVRTTMPTNELNDIAEQTTHALHVIYRDGRSIALFQENGVVRIKCFKNND